MGNLGAPASERRSATTGGGSAPPHPALTPGTRVGRYVVLKTLGRGGMGIVYMAYDEQLDRRVALKLLATDATDAGAGLADRLLREAQAMAKLSHPNVVAIYDVGTAGGAADATGQVFLAMEYVGGVTLRAWRSSLGRSARGVVAMYVQAGRGLAAAHAAGILHRDFKPENVIVDAGGVARVIDFGLARIEPTAVSLDDVAMATTAIDGDEGARPPLTRVGAILGTPEYMAPEQLRGERAEARSDVFAFCAALYEALYGERPYGGETALALLGTIAAERVRPPRGGAKVPRALRAVLLRGLRARPDDRWPTMQAILDALVRATDRRRLHALAAASAIGVASLVAIALLVAQQRRAPACLGADREIAEAWGDAQRSGVKTAFLATKSPRAEDSFARVDATLNVYSASWARMRTDSCEATRVRHAQSDEALDLRTACLDQRRRELALTADVLAKADTKLIDDAVTMVRALPDIGECADVDALRSPYTMPHDPAKRRAVEGMQKGLAEATALLNAERLDGARARIERVLADAREAKNRPIEAAALVIAARVGPKLDPAPSATMLFDAAIEADATRSDLAEADAWIYLVRVAAMNLDHHEESEEYARLAESAIERGGGSLAQRATLLRHRGDADFEQGKFAQSDALYRQALALRSQVFGADSPEVAEIESDLGDNDDAIGQEKKGLAFYESALTKMNEAYGAGHPRTFSVLIGIASLRSNLGDAEGALPIALRAEAVAEDERRKGIARRIASVARIFLGDVNGGIREYYASGERVSGPRRANLLQILGYDLLRRHLTAEAWSAYEESSRLFAPLGFDNDSTLVLRSGRALCLARLGRAKSETLRDAAAVVASGELRANGETHNLSYLALGEVSLALKDAQGAVTVLERVARKAENDDENPEFHADIHLALARALVASGGDRERAISLAERAAREYDDRLVRLPEVAKDARAFAARVARGKSP